MGLLANLFARTDDKSQVSQGRDKTRRALSATEAFTVPTLERAFLKVRANGGGAGGDGITIAAFDRARAERLAALAASLATSVYRPGPVRRLFVAKDGGGKRALTIPCVVDRVAQTAWLFALAPTLEARMHPASFAYRSGRGVAEACAAARSHVAAGRPFVARVDIETFFDSVPHGRLLADLPAWLDDKRYLALARDWIRASAPNGRGLPQGSPISPTLANIVLDPIDRQMASEGFAAVRYADDIAVFCRSSGEARDALKWFGDRLATRGLRVNAAKSRVCHAAGAMFLGQMLAPPLSGWSAFIARIVRRDPDRESPSPRA